MARRADPVKIHEARRAGMLARLEHYGELSAARAEALMSAWESEADLRGLKPGSAWWEQARVWVEEQRPGKA